MNLLALTFALAIPAMAGTIVLTSLDLAGIQTNTGNHVFQVPLSSDPGNAPLFYVPPYFGTFPKHMMLAFGDAIVAQINFGMLPGTDVYPGNMIANLSWIDPNTNTPVTVIGYTPEDTFCCSFFVHVDSPPDLRNPVLFEISASLNWNHAVRGSISELATGYFYLTETPTPEPSAFSMLGAAFLLVGVAAGLKRCLKRKAECSSPEPLNPGLTPER